MIDDGYMVCDKNKNYRKATYKDFAILLRSTKNTANIFEKEITALNIPVFCDATSEYLDSFEIQVIMNLLRVIDNPAIDIPQITVMRSQIGNFTDNELIKIRGKDKDRDFYYSMKDYINKEEADIDIKAKLQDYLKKIENWREKSKYLPLDELIWSIYIETGFYNYVSLMPNGEYRTANLKMLFEKAKTYEKTSFKGLFNFINFIDKLRITSGDMSGAKLIGENENVVRIMSIHKSKGLEFPIVFLSGIGKKFNVMDLNSDDILLHNDLGLGPKFIDAELNIKFDTLAKKAIANKIKRELVAEELRILYVALTRAKEKMIITGTEKNIEKKLQDKRELLQCYEKYNDKKISKNILKKYMRYIDFFELMYLYNENKIKEVLKFETHNHLDIMQSAEKDEEIKDSKIDKILEEKEFIDEEIEKLQDKLNWNYPYIASTKMEAKSSVSKIKRLNNDVEEDIELSFAEPKFLKAEGELKIPKARIGTLTHIVLQRLNEKEDYTIGKIQIVIDDLVKREIITTQEAEKINVKQIYEFTKSKIFEELKTAKKIYREQPFYINIPASMIYDEDTEEKILVQGIIDLYYITQDDRIILVDYKTDYVPEGKEDILKEKYQKQLELYKIAIEDITKKKLDNIYIYSTYLGKNLNIM